MAIKCKAVIKSSSGIFKRARGKAGSKPQEKSQEEPREVEEQVAEGEAQAEQISEEDAASKLAEEVVGARKKELKSMPVADLKTLLEGKGLETGKKDDMVQTLLNFEAQLRAADQAKAARTKAVILNQKAEFEGLSASDLKERCAAHGITGVLSKHDRVEKLLQLWLQDDGIDKALAQLERAKRESELAGMDKHALSLLCRKLGVDPAVKEVMVDRLLRFEVQCGRFDPPKAEPEKSSVLTPGPNEDMVQFLLATEAQRKKDRELKQQQEEAATKKRKELKALPVDELKKLLSNKGLDLPSGKKEDLVEALVYVIFQEEKLTTRKAELKALAKDELKKLVTSMGLQTGEKDSMVEVILSHEAKVREDLKTYAVKLEAALAKKKEELEAMTFAELKDLCLAKNLKSGAGKKECVDRLLEGARSDPADLHRALSLEARAQRRATLLNAEAAALEDLCKAAKVDFLVKEVMVERILAHEDEFGLAVAEPPTKKAKK